MCNSLWAVVRQDTANPEIELEISAMVFWGGRNYKIRGKCLDGLGGWGGAGPKKL